MDVRLWEGRAVAQGNLPERRLRDVRLRRRRPDDQDAHLPSRCQPLRVGDLHVRQSGEPPNRHGLRDFPTDRLEPEGLLDDRHVRAHGVGYYVVATVYTHYRLTLHI